MSKQGRFPTRGLVANLAVIRGRYMVNRFIRRRGAVVTLGANLVGRQDRMVILGAGKGGGVMTLFAIRGAGIDMRWRLRRSRAWCSRGGDFFLGIVAFHANRVRRLVGMVEYCRYKAAARCVTSIAVPSCWVGLMGSALVLNDHCTVRA